MNNELIIIAIVGAVIYYVRSLLMKIGKLENDVKSTKSDGEIKVNEANVKNAITKAISSLERYRALRKSNNDDKKQQ